MAIISSLRGRARFFWREPGTLAIMRILMLNAQSPREIPAYAHLIRRRSEHKKVDVRLRGSSWTMTIFGSVGAIAALYGVLCAGCGGLGLLTVLLAAFPSNGTTLIRFAMLGIGLIAAGGIAIVGAGVSRVIAQARTSHAWDLMLMLPHPRHEVMLYLIAPAYSPGLLIVSLSVIEIFTLGPLAFQKSNYCGWWLVLLAALTAEWMQITALAVSVGLLSARGGLSYALPLLFGLVLMVARTGAGVLVALVLGVPASVFLFAGPVNAVAVMRWWPLGAVIAALYLLALEIGVRWTFAQAVARAGE